MPTKRNALALTSLGLLVLAAGSLDAQVPSLSLSQPDSKFPEAFSLIMGLREMPDGRVMIADPLSQTLVLADMTSGTADTLGGVGGGPGEYRQPDGLLPLPGDSTLLIDLGNARLTVVAPDGSFAETMTMAQAGPGGRPQIILPSGVDSQGRIYFQPFGGGAGGRIPDSATVVRLDRATGAIDTIARVGRPELKRKTSGDSGNQQVAIRVVPLSPQDAWAVGPDGRIAAARAADYHVEWIDAGGRVVRGAAVSYKPVPIKQADREEWAAQAGANGLRIEVSIQNGERQMAFSRGGGSGRQPDTDGLDWPEVKPAFVAQGVWVTPEGDAWVQRSVPAGEPAVIDVFGPDANLKRQVVLPAGRQIVGFGRGAVYLIETDEFGLQWLERHRTS